MSFECGMKWLQYRELVNTGSIDQVKALLREISVQNRNSNDGRVWECIDHLQNFPEGLSTKSSWRTIFQMVTMPNFVWAASKGTRVFRNLEKQKIVFISKSQEFNSSLIVYLKESLVGEGATRKVKKAYDLVSGSYVVHKIIRKDELDLLTHYRNCIGLESIFGFYKYCRNRREKVKCIEELYTKPLSEYKNLSSQSLLVIFKDVLHGLVHFHEGKFQEGNEEFNNFHNDIKLDNIVVQEGGSNKIIKACLIDFGVACMVERIRGTPRFYSPEKAMHFLQGNELFQDVTCSVEDTYARFGQASDLWALGLTFARLLFSQNSSWLHFSGIMNINGMHAFCQRIARLTQDEIDKELVNGKMSQSKERAIFWDIVIGFLKVSPESRLTAREALEYLRQNRLNFTENS